MDDGNNIRAFSAVDIERYHKGSMSAGEMHALEKAAMDDPFLADALDGYKIAGTNASADLAELKKRLGQRTEEDHKVIAMVKPKRYYWMRVAAMLVLVAGAGILAYTLLGKKDNDLANTAFKGEGKKAETDTIVSGSISILTDTIKGTSAKIETFTFDTAKYYVNNNKADQLSTTVGEKVDDVRDRVTNAKPDSLIVITDGYANTTKTLAKDNQTLPQRETAAPTAPVTAGNTNDFYKQKQADVVRADKKQLSSAKEESLELKRNVRNDPTWDFQVENMNQRRAKTMNDSINYNTLNVFRGRVVDASNNPISFANVNIPDVNVGTYADAKGNFTLVAPDSVLNVNLRAVGFNSSQTQLRNNVMNNQVVLQEDRSLEAVVMSNAKPNATRSRTATVELTEPEPSDGWEKYDSYLVNNIKVPVKDDIPLKEKESGRNFVEVSFDVNKDGEPINIKVTKSLCKECDAEAIRLVKEGPKWKNKNKKGKATVTVAF
jgi:hypothetical protein